MSLHETDPEGIPPTGLDEPTPQAEAPPGKKRKRRDPLPFWLELPLLIIAALVIAVLIKTFLIQAFWIPSSSMEETLQVNDRVLVNKLSYRTGDVKRQHVIVFDDPRGPLDEGESLLQSVARNVAEAVGLSTPRSEFIKRVIGLPGESIQIRQNEVYIDGEVLVEPYLQAEVQMADHGPIDVPPGHVFVMGDNRNASQDSRFFGPIPVEDIVGRAFVIIWPPSRWGGL